MDIHRLNFISKLDIKYECARFVLPMSTWSHIVVQCDLNNLTKFLKLRLDKHAQYEIQLIARGMYFLAKEVFPETMKVFDDGMMDFESMSIDNTGFTYEYTSKLSKSKEEELTIPLDSLVITSTN